MKLESQQKMKVTRSQLNKCSARGFPNRQSVIVYNKLVYTSKNIFIILK